MTAQPDKTGPAPHRVRIMGILNVTPDSFSDGGRYLDPGLAVEQAQRLLDDGASMVDVGAESTRPGSSPVTADEEWRRLEPVLVRLAAAGLTQQISVDTSKPDLMLRAAGMGVGYINDVTGTAPPAILTQLAATPDLVYLAMHAHGCPDTMQQLPLAGKQAVQAVTTFFALAYDRLIQAGFTPERIWLDPGIGFGKTDSGNVQLMAAFPAWRPRYNIAIGVSRKSLIGRVLSLPDPITRDTPSKMLEFGLALLGAGIIRTHAVKTLSQMLGLLNEDA